MNLKPSNPAKIRWPYQLLNLLLLLLLAACDLPLISQPTEELLPPVPPNTQDNPVALVTFHVEVPADTPPDEPILFSVLDEVTGLGLNARRYTMEQIDETHYIIGLPLPPGTVLKYRYSRQSEIMAEEHVSDGRMVRYRMYQVTGPGEVHDTVTRWNDTLYSGPTGRITGQVKDLQSGTALPGMLVAVGGMQVFSASDGSFWIEGLPPGNHNMVIYALDGSYRVFQQGALVQADHSTHAEVQLELAPRVDVTLIVRLPENSPPNVPVRLAGNLFQLGNTYANLSGGISTIAARMPVLQPLSDGSYGLIIGLPAGADVRYKYTLGDGFWNAERNLDGSFAMRQLIVPEQAVTFFDTVEAWHVGPAQPITFDVSVPANTPANEGVWLQLNPYGWTEALPMWRLSDTRWAYILYSPVDRIAQVGYRYCRAGQCGVTDDARTPGEYTSGQIAQPGNAALDIPDQVTDWAWFLSDVPQVDNSAEQGGQREEGFLRAIEFQPYYHPSWSARIGHTLQQVENLQANGLILSPSWTFTRLDPPVLEPVAGYDPLWLDLTRSLYETNRTNLLVGLHPQPHFPTSIDEWWAQAPRDFAWWVSWFDRYAAFALHHADLAQQTNAETLILGGAWMEAAMPSGKLADGSPSGVPADAEQRYRDLIAQVRERYDGTLAWALTYPEGTSAAPAFIDQVDQLYIIWSAPLATGPQAETQDLQTEAARILNEDIALLRQNWQPANEQKAIIISLVYPSVDGILTGCLNDPIMGCLPAERLNYPAPDYPLLELDLVEQAQAYDAVLAAVNEIHWISGVVSQGYYPPAILHDKSTSIHGKPAAEVLAAWYTAFAGGE